MMNLLYIYPLFHSYAAFSNIWIGHKRGKETEELTHLTGNSLVNDLIDQCKPLYQKYQLTDIHITHGPVLSGGAQGAALLPLKKTVWVNLGLFQLNPEGMRLSVKHEIAHIKNNDALVHPFIMFLSTFLTTRTLAKLGHSWKVLPVGFALLWIIDGFFRRLWEKRADDFAMAHATDEELKGGIRIHQAFLNVNLEFAKENRLLARFIDSKGEYSWDPANFFHLKSSDRIKQLCELYKSRTQVDYVPTQSELKPLVKEIKEFRIHGF